MPNDVGEAPAGSLASLEMTKRRRATRRLTMKTSRSLALAALRRWRAGTEFANKIVALTFADSGLRAVDRAFALELFYGVLRNLTLLDFWIAQVRDTPIDPHSRDILRLGLYQILLIETAAHAAVFETVELAAKRTRPLVNALLRRALREKVRLTNLAEEQPDAVRYSEPEFLVEKWRQHFGPEAAREFCQWNNKPAQSYARINSLKITAADFLAKYPTSAPVTTRPLFVRLPDPASALAGGDCYMQDPGTTLACDLLDPQPNESILDACAAPGGKSAYLAALLENQGSLTAVDRAGDRLDRLRGNLVRLGVHNTTVMGHGWLESEFPVRDRFFDKILLDAPCSNTGVMRRRVDVRWRLRPNDFVKMPAQQLALLDHLAPLLNPGGSLVYSTCSLEPEENEDVVGEFLRGHPSFRLTNTLKSLPWRDGFDGAFAARLQHSSTVE